MGQIEYRRIRIVIYRDDLLAVTHSRLVLDRSQLAGQSEVQLMLAWEEGPGRAGYLGGGLVHEGDGPLSWQLFSKLSWTWP